MALSALLPAGANPSAVLHSLRSMPAPADRPYLVANLAVTVDGSTSLDGLSGPISRAAAGDREIFRALRDQSDAVLAGTRTLVAEGYRRLIATPERRAAREAAGLPADALAVVISRSGEVPADIPMLTDPEQPSVILTGAEAELPAALRTLRTEHGVELLLCEGGAELLGALVRGGFVDELWVTIAPVLASGAPHDPLIGGLSDGSRRLELRSLLESAGGLHARYAMLDQSPTGPSPTPPGALPTR